jgi:hypothetical protein
MSVEGGGLRVTAGGLTVKSGGLTVATGDVTAGGTVYVGLAGAATDSKAGLNVTRAIGSVSTTITGGLVVNDYISVETGSVTAVDLYVYGSPAIKGGLSVGNIVNPSDRRLKCNITQMTDSLTKLAGMQPVYFSWAKSHMASLASPLLDPATFDDEQHVGLLAQEAAVALPESVRTIDELGHLGPASRTWHVRVDRVVSHVGVSSGVRLAGPCAGA